MRWGFEGIQAIRPAGDVRQLPMMDGLGEGRTLIWNDLVKYLFVFSSSLFSFFFPSFRRRQRKSRSRRLLRRLITLIFAGRNRIIVIRRELPRTSGAGSVRRPTA